MTWQNAKTERYGHQWIALLSQHGNEKTSTKDSAVMNSVPSRGFKWSHEVGLVEWCPKAASLDQHGL